MSINRHIMRQAVSNIFNTFIATMKIVNNWRIKRMALRMISVFYSALIATNALAGTLIYSPPNPNEHYPIHQYEPHYWMPGQVMIEAEEAQHSGETRYRSTASRDTTVLMQTGTTIQAEVPVNIVARRYFLALVFGNDDYTIRQRYHDCFWNSCGLPRDKLFIEVEGHSGFEYHTADTGTLSGGKGWNQIVMRTVSETAYNIAPGTRIYLEMLEESLGGVEIDMIVFIPE